MNTSNLLIQTSLASSYSGSAVAAFVYSKSKTVVGSFVFGSRIEQALELARTDQFEGKCGQLHVITTHDKTFSRIIFSGLGPEKELTLETLRRAVASVARKANQMGIQKLAFRLPLINSPEATAHAATEGALLGTYHYTRYKTNTSPRTLSSITLLAKDSIELKHYSYGIGQGRLFSEATLRARDLINHGPSDTTPLHLVKIARQWCRPPVRLVVYNKARMTRMGMGGILGVNRGSAQAPAFLHWIYRPKGRIHRKIGICGKGITFDSGGLSLKPPQGMETMKSDMSGAAAVFSIFYALSHLKLPIEVHGFTPLTENMPGGRATKPGDVLRTIRGKTIEVLNTDAEGRLVLADALSFACRQSLDEVIDLATLTGAATIALGTSISAIMGTDRDLVQRIKKASQTSGEKIWELPLENDYRSHIDSDVADLKNIGRPGEAGTIIGGLFLKEFVDEGLPWAHLDIAATAFTRTQTALSSPGGTGNMVRTLLHYLIAYQHD